VAPPPLDGPAAGAAGGTAPQLLASPAAMAGGKAGWQPSTRRQRARPRLAGWLGTRSRPASHAMRLLVCRARGAGGPLPWGRTCAAPG